MLSCKLLPLRFWRIIAFLRGIIALEVVAVPNGDCGGSSDGDGGSTNRYRFRCIISAGHCSNWRRAEKKRIWTCLSWKLLSLHKYYPCHNPIIWPMFAHLRRRLAFVVAAWFLIHLFSFIQLCCSRRFSCFSTAVGSLVYRCEMVCLHYAYSELQTVPTNGSVQKLNWVFEFHVHFTKNNKRINLPVATAIHSPTSYFHFCHYISFRCVRLARERENGEKWNGSLDETKIYPYLNDDATEYWCSQIYSFLVAGCWLLVVCER